MEKKQLKVSNDVTAEYHYFSEYVICVEVFKNGETLGSFCSDTSQFEDWDEDEVAEMVKNHVYQVENAVSHQNDHLQKLDDGLEIKYHQHWEDFYCVDVFDKGKEIGSFCADKSSFEEWMEDDQQLAKVVRSQLQR